MRHVRSGYVLVAVLDAGSWSSPRSRRCAGQRPIQADILHPEDISRPDTALFVVSLALVCRLFPRDRVAVTFRPLAAFGVMAVVGGARIVSGRLVFRMAHRSSVHEVRQQIV